MTPTPIILLGIVIIVLLMLLLCVVYSFYDFTRDIMINMKSDITALRNKFCKDLEKGMPVKHVVKPMPERYIKQLPPVGLPPENLQKEPEGPDFLQSPPRVPNPGFGLEGPVSPPMPSLDFDTPSSPDFEPRLPFPPLGGTYVPGCITEAELKLALKRKSNWRRDELLDELGISYKEEDWR